MPKFDGRFVNLEEFENFSIKKEGGKLFIYYNNEGNTRKEEIILLTKGKFGVKNDQDKEYYYKRFEKFSVK